MKSGECTGDASTCTAGNGDEDGVPCPSCQAEHDVAAAEYRKDFGDTLPLSELVKMTGVTCGRFSA